MKMFRFMVVNFILVFALTICMSISKVQAFDFFGEFCWQFNEAGEPPIIFRLEASDVGNQHFILNGNSSGFLTGKIVHGSAEINGSDIIMTLNSSLPDVAETETAIFHVNLSGTLNGTFNAILTVFPKPTGPLISGYASGTFTFISCLLIRDYIIGWFASFDYLGFIFLFELVEKFFDSP